MDKMLFGLIFEILVDSNYSILILPKQQHTNHFEFFKGRRLNTEGFGVKRFEFECLDGFLLLLN
jgi:hypothetical protein